MAEPSPQLASRWDGLAARVREAVPTPLHVGVGFGLELWQALGVLAFVGAAWLLAALGVALLALVARRLSAGTANRVDDELAVRLKGPARLTLLALLVRPLWGLLALPPAVGATLDSGARATMLVALFWALLRGLTVAIAHADASEWARARPGAKSLVRLGGSVAKVGLLALGAMTVLSELNYPVASILAGLGLGGLALALAAQKTVENLFGGFALAADQPFRVGDFIRVEDLVGTVENIGMRSTRLRTLDRTLVSIPNGKLADSRIETFAARDRIRLACTVGLVYGTTAAQLRAVLAGLEAALRAHPKLWTQELVVKLKALAESSLDIEVMAWFLTTDWAEFQQIRQEMLLAFVEVVEKAGSSIAFPSRTVHLVQEGKAPPAST